MATLGARRERRVRDSLPGFVGYVDAQARKARPATKQQLSTTQPGNRGDQQDVQHLQCHGPTCRGSLEMIVASPMRFAEMSRTDDPRATGSAGSTSVRNRRYRRRSSAPVDHQPLEQASTARPPLAPASTRITRSNGYHFAMAHVLTGLNLPG